MRLLRAFFECDDFGAILFVVLCLVAVIALYVAASLRWGF